MFQDRVPLYGQDWSVLLFAARRLEDKWYQIMGFNHCTLQVVIPYCKN